MNFNLCVCYGRSCQSERTNARARGQWPAPQGCSCDARCCYCAVQAPALPRRSTSRISCTNEEYSEVSNDINKDAVLFGIFKASDFCVDVDDFANLTKNKFAAIHTKGKPMSPRRALNRYSTPDVLHELQIGFGAPAQHGVTDWIWWIEAAFLTSSCVPALVPITFLQSQQCVPNQLRWWAAPAPVQYAATVRCGTPDVLQQPQIGLEHLCSTDRRCGELSSTGSYDNRRWCEYESRRHSWCLAATVDWCQRPSAVRRCRWLQGNQMTVTGVGMNRDGIPVALQQFQIAWGAPVQFAPLTLWMSQLWWSTLLQSLQCASHQLPLLWCRTSSSFWAHQSSYWSDPHVMLHHRLLPRRYPCGAEHVMLEGALRHDLKVQGPLEGQSHFRPDKGLLPQTLLLAASSEEVTLAAASKARACAGCRRCLLPFEFLSPPIWWSSFSLGGPHRCHWLYCACVQLTWPLPRGIAATCYAANGNIVAVPYMSECQRWDSRWIRFLGWRFFPLRWVRAVLMKTRSSCTTAGSPSGASAHFRLYGDGSSTAPNRANLLVLPDSSEQDTPVQVILVGFKEKILLSSEESHGAVASDGLTQVHIDPALMRESVYKHFIRRRISLGALDFSWFRRRSAKFFRCWLSFLSRPQYNMVVTDSFSRHKVYMTIGLLPVLTFGKCLVWDRPRPPRMSGSSLSISLATLIGSAQCGWP